MKRPFVLILLLGLALRLAWALTRPPAIEATLGDQAEYLSLARNLLATGEYRFFDARFGQDVYAYRTPGYPLFVAALGANVTAVRVGQAILDASTILAIYLLARRGVGRPAGLWAAGVVAVNPFLIYFTGLILSEALFTAMLAWGMCLLVVGGWHLRVFGIAVLAGAVQVRPSVLGVVPVLAGVGWVVGHASQVMRLKGDALRNGGLRAAGWGALAIAAVVAALLPWAWRNATHPMLQAWVWTTTNNGITLYDGFHDQATGASDQAGFLEKLGPELRGVGEVGRDQFLRGRAEQWIREHPGTSVSLALKKIGRTWSPIPLSSEYGSRAYVAVGLLFSVPVYLLAIAGLWWGPGGKTLKALCLLPAIYFTVVHALSVGSLRYRVPCEPPMAVIAGAGAAALLAPRHESRSPK